MKNINILKTIKKVPGGMMVIPLFLGVLVKTFIPKFLELGGLTTALWAPSSASPFIALCMVVMGSQMNLRQLGEGLKRGAVLTLAKFIAGAAVGLLIGKVFGAGGFLGISALAFVSAVTNSNGGLYMSLVSEFGGPEDMAAQSVLGINDGPFLTMLAFSASGMADIPFMSLIAAIIPLLFGVVIGNLDKDIAAWLKPISDNGIMIPFFAFCLGAGISLANLVKGGLPGILLGFTCVLWSGLVCILADKFINRRPGYAGASIASAAGNCVSTPALVAAVAVEMEPYAETATVQCAAAVVVTAICVPILASWAAKKWGTDKEWAEKVAAKKAAKAAKAENG